MPYFLPVLARTQEAKERFVSATGLRKCAVSQETVLVLEENVFEVDEGGEG